MTDEERQKLCDKLRSGSIRWLMKAADEMERLAALLKDYRLTFGDIHDVRWADGTPAQSNAEPPREIYDKVKGHAVTQSDVGPMVCPNCGVSVWQNDADRSGK